MSRERSLEWLRRAVLRFIGQARVFAGAWLLAPALMLSSASVAQERGHPAVGANRAEAVSADALSEAVRTLSEQVRALQASVTELRSDSQQAQAETRELRRELDELRGSRGERKAVVLEAVVRDGRPAGQALGQVGNPETGDQQEQKVVGALRVFKMSTTC